MIDKKRSFWHIGTIYDDVAPKDQWWPALLQALLACFLSGMYLSLVIKDYRPLTVFEWIASAIAVYIIGRTIYEFVLKLRASINARKNT
jgi:hypothetical protein